MAGVPEWDDAIDQFTNLLRSCGHPMEIEWVFRGDVWQRSVKEMLVCRPVPQGNTALCRRVFESGRDKGLVNLLAIGGDEATVLCTVWYPKLPNEEVQGWDSGMKLSIANPLARAKRISQVLWPVFRVLPRFRRYQRFEGFVPTRAWGICKI
jgi:hypothetical protein